MPSGCSASARLMSAEYPPVAPAHRDRRAGSFRLAPSRWSRTAQARGGAGAGHVQHRCRQPRHQAALCSRSGRAQATFAWVCHGAHAACAARAARRRRRRRVNQDAVMRRCAPHAGLAAGAGFRRARCWPNRSAIRIDIFVEGTTCRDHVGHRPSARRREGGPGSETDDPGARASAEPRPDRQPPAPGWSEQDSAAVVAGHLRWPLMNCKHAIRETLAQDAGNRTVADARATLDRLPR